MRFVIITGLSGAGKSQAIRCMEDLGFYCVDNMPPALIPKFAEICFQSQGKIEKVALVIDIRGGDLFNELFNGLDSLTEAGYMYEILFLEASDEVLIKRYKESRRKHPLASEGRIVEAIEAERKLLQDVRNRADHIIDTSNLLARQLKEQLTSIFVEGKQFEGIIITVLSFGFKYGIPLDSDLVFDVRFLPNPYYINSLKDHTGQDEDVRNYVLKWPQANEFLKKLEDLVEFLIPNYIEEGKSQLVISIGCTGGKHRSVTIAEALYKYLIEKNHRAIIHHRDIEKDNRGGQ
ncbi:MAG: RNase adapter protein RapZ [Petroclostridium sp.]|uniref:RNase adapter RapZ n=1 Tax=Petroclostridium xylanilyticum TaxID=1792311 RepID=UPI000B98242A|nr:RNase adapter RapZ [Petroclostridium xylanilyticum]MBZ4646611.1 RNase adaptor protein RapZ [Clostridia bacterium]MDK2810608.1 RNase adapter protein RapZ [Petroclostridium sp.]